MKCQFQAPSDITEDFLGGGGETPEDPRFLGKNPKSEPDN